MTSAANARRDGTTHMLTDEGLTILARRDRAVVGSGLDCWTPQQAEDWTYIGTGLRAITYLTRLAVQRFSHDLIRWFFSSQVGHDHASE